MSYLSAWRILATSAGLRPVFQRRQRQALKVPGVVGDHCEAIGDGGGPDEQVEIINELPISLQASAFTSINSDDRGTRKYGKGCDKLVNKSVLMSRTLAGLGSDAQLSFGNFRNSAGGNSNLGQACHNGSRISPQQIDADVGIEQVR